MVKVSCVSIKDFFKQLDEDLFIEESSILMVLSNEYCLGRRALSRRTCISERRVREAVSKLIDKGFLTKNNDLCINKDKLEFFTRLCFESFSIDDYILTTICCFDSDVLEKIRNNITDLRDHIVISTGKPWVFEIIGIREANVTVLPKVPKRIASKYHRFLNKVFNNGSILVLWKEYKPFINESILLQGLFKICISSK